MKRIVLAELVLLGALTSESARADSQISGNAFFGYNGTHNDSISHQSGYAYNTNTGTPISLVASLPLSSQNAAPKLTFFVRGNGQTLSCQQYAINEQTRSVTFTTGSTTGSGNISFTTQLSIPATFFVRFYHGALCTLPKALGTNYARIYGAITNN